LLNLTKHQSKKPLIQFDPKLPNISGKPVLLVDDVLNSGRTLSYCLSPLVELEIPSLRIAVLVERTYRKFPVSSSITGLSLSTTFEENVVALLKAKPEEMGVFLS
jgi:pyrimidine operon attenuation protein/uracil phosphoribosyltransferase